MTKPYRINVPVQPAANDDKARENMAYSESLGLPDALGLPATSKKLAVVGSSPNIDFDSLRDFDGDIWAVNGTAKILTEENIPFSMISVDPFNYDVTGLFEKIFYGVERALLASNCNPLLFDYLKDKDVQVFNCAPWAENTINGGPTTATRAPLLALKKGYQEVHFFGLEGSFHGQSHYYKDEVDPRHKLTIRAGGVDYPSCVELMLQSENLAQFILSFPDVFKDRSGGLLTAMIENIDDWEVVETSETIKASLIKEVA